MESVIPNMIESGDCVWFDTYIFTKKISKTWYRFSEICQQLVSDGGKVSFFTEFPKLDIIPTLKNNLKNFKLTETIIRYI